MSTHTITIWISLRPSWAYEAIAKAKPIAKAACASALMAQCWWYFFKYSHCVFSFSGAKLIEFQDLTKFHWNPAANLQLGYAIYLRSQVCFAYFAPITSDMSCFVRFSTIASQRRESWSFAIGIRLWNLFRNSSGFSIFQLVITEAQSILSANLSRRAQLL